MFLMMTTVTTIEIKVLVLTDFEIYSKTDIIDNSTDINHNVLSIA